MPSYPDRTSEHLRSARIQLERSDDVDGDRAQLVRRVTLIGRAVDDLIDAVEQLHRRLAALEQPDDEVVLP